MTHLQYIERFIAEGKTEADFYAWAKECGQKASNSYKDKKLCEQLGIEAISELETYKMLDCSDLAGYQETNNFILNHCENPADLAASLLELKKLKVDENSKEGYLNQFLTAFPKASFLRYSDKNRLTDISAAWFKNDGIELDVQVEILSEGFGIEITVDDVLDFVFAYKKGKWLSEHNLLMQKYQTKIDTICGFQVPSGYLNRLADIVLKVTENQIVELETVPF